MLYLKQVLHRQLIRCLTAVYTLFLAALFEPLRVLPRVHTVGVGKPLFNWQMSAMDKQPNPALLQQGDPSRTPLFLVHDAGGGIYDYYKLENIGRPVYAIHNPWFKNVTKWEGGAMMFVEKYIKLIKSVVPKGDILVGGKISEDASALTS